VNPTVANARSVKLRESVLNASFVAQVEVHGLRRGGRLGVAAVTIEQFQLTIG
jgi:hypothetical protein